MYIQMVSTGSVSSNLALEFITINWNQSRQIHSHYSKWFALCD